MFQLADAGYRKELHPGEKKIKVGIRTRSVLISIKKKMCAPRVHHASSIYNMDIIMYISLNG